MATDPVSGAPATWPIVVLGGGPAGAATAIGLARLGERVIVIGEPRRPAAIEGVSPRVVDALTRLGLRGSVATIAAPSPRRALWRGQPSSANTEALVERRHFDQALLADLESLGIEVLRGRIGDVSRLARGHRIEVMAADGRRAVAARFLVEARGRTAPAAGLARWRGPETVSLLQHWRGPAGAAMSAVEGIEDGWLWMASLANGHRYLQFTTDARATSLPSRRDLARFCLDRFRAASAAAGFLAGAEPDGPPLARASTPILDEPLAGADWIRVGDAAMAVDPLSGNGIFQALSSALQAPAVILTLLGLPDRAALAQGFHRARVRHLFERFARIGRDFYTAEDRWPAAPFWQARRAWPDAGPVHPAVTPAMVTVARRPVLDRGEIVEADVVVTPAQPLGIWHLDGLPMAPVLTAIRTAPPGVTAVRALSSRLGLPAERAAAVVAWMQREGWIDDRSRPDDRTSLDDRT